ncbi:Cytochrome c, class I [gamma proteobacterium HdN1]|nr:Cytochrome c, class I [gamma proteobacterium HdN1]
MRKLILSGLVSVPLWMVLNVGIALENSTQVKPAQANPAQAKPVQSSPVSKKAFVPPPESEIPEGKFGDTIRLGRDIFLHTRANAPEYVGNDLNCSNCHLDAGRRANSGPLWAAYVRYPMYRPKNDKVNTFAERLQGCFMYSMNGKAPPADSEVIKALTAYSYWLATGAPTGVNMPGFGYPKQGFEPKQAPSYERGEAIYAEKCALCHGENGEGVHVKKGEFAFPALWGANSFNWGAGMHELNNAAAFIKHNMPLGLGGTLTDQEAWDVAMFMDSHERPQDPRYNGNIQETRKKYHDTKWSLYGIEVNGKVLGQGVK